MSSSSDPLAGASALSSLANSLKLDDSQDTWSNVQTTARAIADTLRVKDPVNDIHTLIGRTSLPPVLANLFSLALHDLPIPDDVYAAPLNELLRIAANLCMDHSKWRFHSILSIYSRTLS
jgi:hypothetical protein